MAQLFGHWICKFKGAVLHSTDSRADAAKFLADKFSLSDESREQLHQRLVIRVKRKGLVEIETCDCKDGLHIEPPVEYTD